MLRLCSMWRPFRTLHTIRCNNLARLRTAGDTWRQVLPLPTPPLPRLEARKDLSPHCGCSARLRNPKPDHAPDHGARWSLNGFRAKLPMDHTASSERPRKRRAINACVNCRTSKVRCDGKRPCQRCERNDAVCQYHEAIRDESILRIEKLEAEVATLRHEMNNNLHQQSAPAAISTARFNEHRISPNAIDAGVITWEQAASWYQRYCIHDLRLKLVLMLAQLLLWQCMILHGCVDQLPH
jgi:hypothetical protein